MPPATPLKASGSAPATQATCRTATYSFTTGVKDMIISGGENIYPAEIENVLMSHEGIADAAVIGVPSERWGEAVKAIIKRADSSLTEEDVISFCRQRLAHYKCPTSVDWIDELPRNPSGKILKVELRKPFWEGRERLVS